MGLTQDQLNAAKAIALEAAIASGTDGLTTDDIVQRAYEFYDFLTSDPDEVD